MTVPCNQLKKLLRRILSHSFSRTPTCVWHRQLIATRPAAVQGRVASVCRGGAALVRRAEEEDYAVTRGPWARGGGQGPPCWEGQALGITGRGIRSNLESRNWHVQVASCQPCSLWLLPGRPSGESLAAQTEELRGGQREQAQPRGEPHDRGCRLVSCFWPSVNRTPGSARGLWPPPARPQGLLMAGVGGTRVCPIPPAVLRGRPPRPTP